jgi:FkbM family methyltransferase
VRVGDFGLYAAACGCQVYLFEVQPAMVDLIESSITCNNFSSSRVQVINKAVSDLPTNSQLTFAVAGGDTTAKNGSLHVSTIRLDDIPWPEASKILLLKIDVEGFELNVLRSAERLFRERRIQHLIFEYTAWWTDRSAQKDLLPFVQEHLQVQTFYALDRLGRNVYGPLDQETLEQFNESHRRRRLQTDIYAPLINLTASSMIQAKPYDLESAMA